MFGTSLILCFSLLLLHGVAAKPYKPLNEQSIQDTIMGEGGEEGEQHWDLQVEPPESLDMTSYDIDPSMKIWKRADQSGPDGEYRMAEGDRAELHHLSMVEVVPLDQAEIDPPSMVEELPLNQDASDSDGAAPDAAAWDVPGQDEEERQFEIVRAYLALLSGNIAGGRTARWTPVDVVTGSDVMSPSGARLHSEPEEDFDDLYHADQPEVVQVEVQPPAGSDIREQTGVRLHLEPEEDLDDLYHLDQIDPRVADEDDM